jgi:hypothetical protein
VYLLEIALLLDPFPYQGDGFVYRFMFFLLNMLVKCIWSSYKFLFFYEKFRKIKKKRAIANEDPGPQLK